MMQTKEKNTFVAVEASFTAMYNDLALAFKLSRIRTEIIWALLI